jgi:sterol desaturase/sphingolipid hydroxylase (fatty acid hydroxylase superfamily)
MRAKLWGAVVRFASYPVIFGGATAVLLVVVGAGHSYWKVGPPLLLACAALLAWLERVQPHALSWQTARGDVATDAAHAASNLLASHGALIGYALTSPMLNGGLALWPAQLAFAIQVVLALLIIDLNVYAVHVASHHVDWLWRLHAIHHSAERLYSLNGHRRHFVHELLAGAPALAVLGLLGASQPVIACAIAIATLHFLFQHANIDYRVGPFKYLIAVAHSHRWHHQRDYAAVQGNYGGFLSMWDYVFATALAKPGDAPTDVGLDAEPSFPRGFIAQLGWPFGGPRARPAAPIQGGAR